MTSRQGAAVVFGVVLGVGGALLAAVAWGSRHVHDLAWSILVVYAVLVTVAGGLLLAFRRSPPV